MLILSLTDTFSSRCAVDGRRAVFLPIIWQTTRTQSSLQSSTTIASSPSIDEEKSDLQTKLEAASKQCSSLEEQSTSGCTGGEGTEGTGKGETAECTHASGNSPMKRSLYH